MSQQIAHNIESKCRTQDIHIRDNVDFKAMLLSDRVLHGLQKSGFKKPSPIQLKAIPMGRCGFDLIIKAKSGTGKTAVFGIVALEMVNVKSNDLQILILAPTREIAVQIQQVLLTIGIEFQGLKIEYFIGGTKLDDDTSKLKNCHIAVGAPGRVKHLIKKGAMKLDSVRLFVLDEADKLMQNSYQADINFIYNKLSARKQMIASSATYPDELDSFLTKYMTSPTHISPDRDVPVLLGIKQFVAIVPSHLNVIQQMALKTDELVRILQTISFTQCIVFSNYQTRAESLSNNLKRLGWPAIHICGAQKQKDRLEAVDRLKEFKCRILSTTDLTARGIDAANVDLVINYEVPYEAETYLHRMGRAGRYGAYGICITIATDGVEVEKLQKIIGNIGDGTLSLAKYPVTEKLPTDIWKCNVRDFAQLTGKVERIVTDQSEPSTSNTDVQSSELPDTQQSEPTGMEKQDNSASTQPEIICNTAAIYDGIKNDIIRVMAADKQVEMVDFVEKTLSNLNKEQEAITTQLKHQYGEVDASALFEKLVKQIDENVQTETPKPLVEQLKKFSDQTMNEDLESMNGVEKIFENISKREEISKMNMKEKLAGLDSNSILDMLSKGVKFDENIDKSDCKKAKVNETVECDKDAGIRLVTNENVQFENEAKMFQENNIVNKNIALYNVAALLADKQQTVDEQCVTSIGHLLNIIQQEDAAENANIDLQTALADVLNIKADSDINMTVTKGVINTDKIINTNQEILDENRNGKIQCGCSENVFSDVYACAVSENDQDWTCSLCKKHAGAKDDMDESEQMYDEYYGEEDNANNEQTLYNAYSTEETEYDGEEHINKREYDEDLFMKAYEYALDSEIDENLIEYNTVSTLSESIDSPEVYGYVAGHSYKNFSRKKTNKRKHTNYDNKMAECMDDTVYTHENYESQYDYLDKLLTRTVPMFHNVQSFEKFFRKWQEDVSAVRNYIQHDVYVKEMLRQHK
ncbi:Gemin 3 [Carabus blaptoides fortunei]